MTMWPLVPNWTSGVKETLAFRTEIITSRKGKEHRRALRRTPRRSFTFAALADQDRLIALDRLMATSQATTMLMPEITRGVRTTSAIPAGGSTVSVRSVPAWLVAGATVALAARRRVYQFEVDSVVGFAVTFTSAAPSPIRSAALLSPTVEGWLPESLKTALVTDQTATVEVEFDVAPGTEAPNEGALDYGAWFNGREILTARPNWSRAPTLTYSQPVETVDYGRGRVARFQPVEFGTRIQQAVYLNRTAAEVEYLRQFFSRMKGQRGEFYHSTWKPDMTMAADAVEGSSELTISGREVYDTYADDTVHQAIQITTNAGWTFARKIASIALVGGNSVLTLTSPWAFGLTVGEVHMVSWLLLSRFASDTLTIDWVTDQVAQTVLNVKSLEWQPAEGEMEELDEGTEYIVEAYGWDFAETVFINPLHEAMNVTLPEIFA